MVLNRFLFVFVLLSGVAIGQSSLRVPSAGANQCEGASCVNGSQEQDTAGLDDADVSDQSARSDQSSKYDRKSMPRAGARSSGQNGPSISPYPATTDRGDEFPRNGNEPVDLSLTYPPTRQQPVREEQ